ncbi:hypothetical protein ACFL1E_05875 [Candidatus Omnitrophota bacterium]
MLKRYQILLNDWLADHIRAASEKYDISFSETTRLALCLQFMQLVNKVYPKYKPKVTEAEITNLILKRNKSKVIESDKQHKLFSKIYFETRKALEFWATQEKKKKR